MRRAAHTHNGEAVPASPLNGRRGCNGKKTYDTFHDASRVALLVRRNKDGSRVEGYRCKVCRGFHIGNPPGKRLAVVAQED